MRATGRTASLRALCIPLALAACAGEAHEQMGDDGGASPGANDCVPARAHFAQHVWTSVLDRVCINCHSPDGVATEQNAMLQLLPASYPGFLDTNYENVRYVARFAFDGKSVLLRNESIRLTWQNSQEHTPSM